MMMPLPIPGAVYINLISFKIGARRRRLAGRVVVHQHSHASISLIRDSCFRLRVSDRDADWGRQVLGCS